MYNLKGKNIKNSVIKNSFINLPLKMSFKCVYICCKNETIYFVIKVNTIQISLCQKNVIVFNNLRKAQDAVYKFLC